MSENIENGIKELAEYTFNLGKNNGRINLHEMALYKNATPVALIQKDMKIEDLSPLMPSNPTIKSKSLLLFDPKSFVRYVKEHKNVATRIFASIDSAPYMFKAVIDYHGIDGQPADWCEHKAELQLKLTDQFKAWQAKDNDTFNQVEFAEFLKDNRLDIIEPNNADILTMAMGLEANVESRVISKLPTNEGVELSFAEDVNTVVNGEKVTVPSSLTIQLPVFLGGEAFEIEADFKMRTREGRIFFAYRLLGVDKLIRDTVTAMAEKLENATGVPVYI